MLNDLFGWYKRNLRKMSDRDKRQALIEIKRIQLIIEKELGEAI